MVEDGFALRKANQPLTHLAPLVSTLEVGCQSTDHDSADTTGVEDIVLNDDMRMVIARLGASRIIKLDPKDVALLDHHSFSTIRRCGRRMAR